MQCRFATLATAILIAGAFMVGHANAQYYRYPPRSPLRPSRKKPSDAVAVIKQTRARIHGARAYKRHGTSLCHRDQLGRDLLTTRAPSFLRSF
jgi:hypothetical protein